MKLLRFSAASTPAQKEDEATRGTGREESSPLQRPSLGGSAAFSEG